MNPVWLRTFLAVFRQRSFTRAADELDLTQPAVSRQMQQLTRTLGVRLFEQIGKSLHPTDAAVRLAQEAQQLLGGMERAIENVRSHASPERGRLRVGASTTPGLWVLPPLLGRFHRRFPDVEVTFTVENSLAIEEKIVRNELDVGFVGAHLASAKLHVEQIGVDEIVCFAGPEHPLAHRRRVNLASLADETWVVREGGSATNRLFESWLGEHGVHMRRTIELRMPEAIKNVVAAGIGISFMSLRGIEDDIRRKRLTRLRVAGTPDGRRLIRPLFFVCHLDKHLSPAMKTYVEMVRAKLGAARGPSRAVARTRG